MRAGPGPAGGGLGPVAVVETEPKSPPAWAPPGRRWVGLGLAEAKRAEVTASSRGHETGVPR